MVFPYHADLVEALFRAGRTEAVAQATARFAARAGHEPTPASRAAIVRCRGAHRRERSRCQDAFRGRAANGARARQRLPDRSHPTALRSAATACPTPSVGARTAPRRPYDLRPARRPPVVAAGGPRAPRRYDSTEGGTGPAALTSQELQVARLVADGKSNREAASALFLSAKIIEYHLSNVYAKFGIRSRVELVRGPSRRHRPSPRGECGCRKRRWWVRMFRHPPPLTTRQAIRCPCRGWSAPPTPRR